MRPQRDDGFSRRSQIPPDLRYVDRAPLVGALVAPAIEMFALNDLLGGGQVEMVGNTIEAQFNSCRDWLFGSALGIKVTLFFAAVAVAGRRGR